MHGRQQASPAVMMLQQLRPIQQGLLVHHPSLTSCSLMSAAEPPHKLPPTFVIPAFKSIFLPD